MRPDSDTYRFATATGDKRFLDWIHARLLVVYGENELYDFMHTLRAFSAGINECVAKANAYDRIPRFIRWWFAL